MAFLHEGSTMEFFGTYLEVTPDSRLVWTNEEGANGKTVTTVTFDEIAGKTLLVVHDRYPSKEALDSGSTGAMPEEARAKRPTSATPAVGARRRRKCIAAAPVRVEADHSSVRFA